MSPATQRRVRPAELTQMVLAELSMKVHWQQAFENKLISLELVLETTFTAMVILFLLRGTALIGSYSSNALSISQMRTIAVFPYV